MAKPNRAELEELRDTLELPAEMSDADLLIYWEARESVRRTPQLMRAKEVLENPLWMTSAGLSPTSMKVCLVITLASLFGCVRDMRQGFSVVDIGFWLVAWLVGVFVCFLVFRRGH